MKRVFSPIPDGSITCQTVWVKSLKPLTAPVAPSTSPNPAFSGLGVGKMLENGLDKPNDKAHGG